MITLNRTELDSVSNSVLNDCLALSNVTDSDCTNTVSPLFTNCTENFTSILNQSWLTVDNEINEVGQAALYGLASGGANLIDWAYSTVVVISTSTFNLVDTDTPNGTYLTDFYNDVNKTLIETKNITFSSGNASTTLAVNVGNAVHSLHKGNNPPTTGIVYVGVTQ